MSPWAPGILYAKVGLRPYARMELWGASQHCGDADANGGPEYVKTLTLDHDVGLSVVAEIGIVDDAALPIQNPIAEGFSFTVLDARKHVTFVEISGNGRALAPMLGGLAHATEDRAANGTVRMRPCYPYADSVDYSVRWGAGRQSPYQGGAAAATAVTHTWGDAKSYATEVYAGEDHHGRILGGRSSRTVTVLPQTAVTKPSGVQLRR